MKKIALYFGSFNPVHIGHLIIANYCLSFSDMDALYFVLSPQNPFKEEKDLLGEQQRLEMLKMAIQDNPAMKISDVEFRLPKPSYTINS
ncbi:MAG TPA: nicotinic acid mononucleotide adenylyltransferase, partial [Bacteroidetes bacterium]|nr:nicotinic acid mononucleotide adenylyltransferase [Bacteroidota bacterium]